MQKSEYLSYVERDQELFTVVEPMLSGIGTLSAEQIETLIFYLKSLHAYYPASENHTEHYYRFSKQLEALRTTGEQVALQSKAARQLFLAMLTGCASGILAALGGVALIGGGGAWGGAMVAAALGLFVLAEALFGKPALVTAKEQDRRHFLESLRAARACSELDWAGLFSHNGITQLGSQSDADIQRTGKRIAELSSQLRDALYNDEYMQYSHQRDPGP